MARLRCVLADIRPWLVLLILAIPLAARPASAMAGAARVSGFYPISKESFDQWAATHYVPPPRQAQFPSGITVVAFYFAYTAPAQGSTYLLVVRGAQGATVTTAGPYVLPASGSAEIVYVTAPANQAFADGSYAADLVVDGTLAASTVFQIQKTAGGLTVSTLYSTDAANYTTWAAQHYAPPPPLTTFAPGTRSIGFYFAFSGATPRVTRFTLIINDADGAEISSYTGIPPVFAASVQMFVLPASHPPYTGGTYQVTLRSAYQLLARTTFVVSSGAQTSAGVARSAAFYTTTATAYYSWSANHFAAPSPVSRFPVGAPAVAFYFTYAGVTPRVTTFVLEVRNQHGDLVRSSAPFVVGLAASWEMDLLGPAHGGYQAGVYTAALLSGGVVLNRTTFTVHGTGPVSAVAISAFIATTRAAYTQWRATHRGTPAVVARVPVGTAHLGFFFAFSGALPGVTTFEATVRARNGAIVADSGSTALRAASGWKVVYLHPAHGGFTAGSDTVTLAIDGQVVASTAYQVG